MLNKKKYNGAREEFSPIRNFDYEVVCGSKNAVKSVTYPSEYEIPRENTGTLKDQGYVGACVAEVIVSIIEEWYRREFGVQEEHSEGFYYGANRSESSTHEGMYPTSALDYGMKNGSVPKKYFDMLVEMPDMKKLLKDYPELYEEAKKYRIKGFTQLKGTGKVSKDTLIKEALTKYQYGLVAIAPTSFTGGSHCIQLTGWNDAKGKYKFKNSWGASYGDNGFAEIDKEDIDSVYLILFDDIKLPFDDVSEDDWFYGDVINMYFAGLIKGVSETKFDPNAPLTRAEACALMNRILKEVDARFKTQAKINRDYNKYFNN